MKEMRKVAVLVSTYNHERFIEESVRSVVTQKTDFDYRVIIMDDCSTDQTRKIVVRLRDEFPEKIELILADKNRNDNSLWREVIHDTSSPYVAIIHGDDYWTSSDKLQKQADYMDAHPEIAIIFHNATTIYEDGSVPAELFNPTDQKLVSTLDDLWKGNFIAGCAPMIRKAAIGYIPEWFIELKWGDWPLYILAARHGTIGYVNDVMGVYRVHRAGLWSGRNETQQIEGVIQFYEAMNRNLEYHYNPAIRASVTKCYYRLAVVHERNIDFARARWCAAKCIARGAIFDENIPTRHLFRVFLRSCFPISHSRVSTAGKKMQ
jgi:glycosyltransferase involved in cell wall biosynthesis